MDFLKFTVIISIAVLNVNAAVDRPRGVSLSKKSLYSAERDFTCLNGQRTIPFTQVNDDYCDCDDGSDEPGTSACPNGYFHCTNAGFKPLNIPSSRVNDGICDCCDSSDEWGNPGTCVDDCKEKWKNAREDMLRYAETAKRGYEVRQQYVTRGMEKKKSEQDRLDTLLKEVESLKEEEAHLKLLKEEAEKSEAEAKAVEQTAWDEFKAKIQTQQETRQAADAFTELDVNKDGSVSINELRSHVELDGNPDDGAFTDEEINAILDGESADAPHFIEVVWTHISSKFVKQVAPEPVEPEATEHPESEPEDEEEEFLDEDEDFDGDYEDDLDDEHDDDDDDDEDDDLPEEEPDSQQEEGVVVEPPAETQPSSSLPDQPVWNDHTQALIHTANGARTEYEQNEKKKSEMEKEISALQKTLVMDFGPDQAFHELKGNCYEWSTHEYTYKVCPFDKAVQIPKNGGAETNLGRWGSWSGPANNKYASMKYTNGLRCWNGPDRSTEVKISCGAENNLSSASEPSRCEYMFTFSTPAACEPVDVPEAPHDEL